MPPEPGADGSLGEAKVAENDATAVNRNNTDGNRRAAEGSEVEVDADIAVLLVVGEDH
jgi:hypothetical protein